MMGTCGHVFTLLLLGVLTQALAANPGVKMRITHNGIVYANSIAESAIRRKLNTLTVTDQSGTEGKLSWSLTNIRNRGISGPNTHIALNPENGGLTLTFSNFGISMSADWALSYRFLFFTLRGHGSIEAEVANVALSVTVGLGHRDGRPSVDPRTCSCQIGHLGLNIHGGLVANVLNMFKGAVQNKLNPLLQDLVCNLVRSEISGHANEALAKMKVHVEFGKFFNLDYSLVAPPSVTSTYLDIENKGEIFWKNDRRESSLLPNTIPADDVVNSMLTVWLTEYTANTFGDVAHRNGYLQYNLSATDIPGGNSDLKNITSQTQASNFELRIRSTAAPIVRIANQHLTTSAWGEVEVVAQTQSGISSFLTIAVNVSLTIEPFIEHERLVAGIANYSFGSAVRRSSIANFDEEELHDLLHVIMESVIIPALNDFGSKGIDLPVTGSLAFYNTRLNLVPGVLRVATDVRSL